jgi:hypothetical protein
MGDCKEQCLTVYSVLQYQYHSQSWLVNQTLLQAAAGNKSESHIRLVCLGSDPPAELSYPVTPLRPGVRYTGSDARIRTLGQAAALC